MDYSHGFTQADCVGWDESDNIDLRTLDASFQDRSPRFCLDDDDDDHDDDDDENNVIEEEDRNDTTPVADNIGYGRQQRYSTHYKATLLTEKDIENIAPPSDSVNQLKDAKEDQENLFGVVHARKRRRKRRRGGDVQKDEKKLALSSSSSKNDSSRRLSVSSSDGGGNKALAALLKQVSTPASVKSSTDQKKRSNNNDDKSSTIEEKHTGTVQEHGATRKQQASPTEALVGSSVETPVADEFNLMDFSMADLAQIDNLVNLATQVESEDDIGTENLLSPQVAQSIDASKTTKINRCISGPIALDSTTIDLDREPLSTLQGKSMHKESELPHSRNLSTSNPPVHNKEHIGGNASQAMIEDDEFDFPDLDFVAIDETIARRSAQTQRSVSDNSLTDLSDKELLGMVPPKNVPVSNKRRAKSHDNSDLTFDRFQVVRVKVDDQTCTKILVVALWNDSMRIDETRRDPNLRALRPFTAGTFKGDGIVFLRGEWYHTVIDPGDIIHICSLTGKFETGLEGLPLMMHTTPPAASRRDDLILIVHPDILLSPTIISETMTCTRRAVLKNRLGSTGITCKFVERMRNRQLESVIAASSNAILTPYSCGSSLWNNETRAISGVPSCQQLFQRLHSEAN